MKTRILLVEDDQNFGLVLKSYLAIHQFEVTLCTDGQAGLAGFLNQGPFDLAILDVMMPKKDGFSLAKEIKSRDAAMPLIFLTARNQKEDLMQGYQLGADDYLTKPFDSEVLLLKIKAILHRAQVATQAQAAQAEELSLGRFTLYPSVRELIGEDGETRHLSPKESDLLTLLVQHKNQILPRELALGKIWKSDSYFAARSMDVYITRLRKILAADPSLSITNVHGAGYKLGEASPVVRA